uniref:JAB1/MPN/MOV34 metalloenzyme domain-containing protein n=1 Tax=Oryza barthii TaxID=65489 RepID=A0A0D3HFF5_9ORYZ
MPPHEDTLDAGGGDVLTFRLHPLAVLKLSDRIRECVIGVRRDKKAFPDLSVLGWYSIGTNVHATDMGIHHGDYTDMQIHQTLMDANGTAFYLLLNPAINFSQKDIPVTIYERGVERISLDHADFVYPSPCIVYDVLAPPLGKEKNAFRTMLFETPSGFAMFRVSDVLFRYPEVVRTIGFIEIGDKSVVWDKDIGPGEDLEQFILKFPITKSLVVPDAQLKFIIEKKLNIGCWFNGRIVPELIWGVNYALDEFVPREKGNLSNECHFPLSKQLHEQLKAYGFSISPELINREFITSFGYLNYLERTSKNISGDLHQKFDRFFCGLEMSEGVFVKVVADRLRSMEEVASTPGRREALSNAEFLLTVPKKKYNTLSRLKRMEAEVRGSGPWVFVAVFAVAFGVMEGLRIAMKRAN